jgi:hypothetical protein
VLIFWLLLAALVEEVRPLAAVAAVVLAGIAQA